MIHTSNSAVKVGGRKMWLLKQCKNEDCGGDLFYDKMVKEWRCFLCARQHIVREGLIGLELGLVVSIKPIEKDPRQKGGEK